MLKWHFHQYSDYKKPFVWHVTGVSIGGRPEYQFFDSVMTRRSVTGKVGDFEFAIGELGLYKVGNTRDHNGYRFVFQHRGVWRYRSLSDEADAIAVARKLQTGEPVQDITQKLIDKFKWHFPNEPP